MKTAPIITIFGSSRLAETDAGYREARELGKALAERRFAVCTGGYGGAMEAISRGAKDGGGKTYGVTSDSFLNLHANEWVDTEVRVKTWQERLFELITLADGFVVLPGGTGTLAELSVVLEMMNQSLIGAKPVVSLGNFWDPVLQRLITADQSVPSASSQQPATVVKSIQTFATSKEVASYLAQILLP